MATALPSIKGGYKHGKKRSKSQCAFHMEMPVAHRIRTEIPQESDIWTIKGGYRTNTAEAVRGKESRNHRSGGMCRPHPYARKYSTASKCSTIHGISQGKKHANDIRSSRKSQIQVWESALLVPWILCGHGRKKCKENTGIHT